MPANRNGRRRNFSSFTLKEALAKAGISDIRDWPLPETVKEPSTFHEERMRRLSSFGDWISDGAKHLLIEAVLEEVAVGHPGLKTFISAPLQGLDAGGRIDYLVSMRRTLPETPLLCVVIAKKGDFVKGLAHIVVEMTVCAELNASEGKMIDLDGVVSNGTGWELLKRSVSGEFNRSGRYVSKPPGPLLGALDYLFTQCDANLETALGS